MTDEGPPDPAIRRRTANLLRHRDPDLAAVLDGRDVGDPLSVVEVRAIVVRLRALMMDATFDDTHIGAEIEETSELYELWRLHLSQVD